MAEPSVATSSVVRQQGEGQAIWMLGGFYEIRLSASDTGGTASLVEFTVPVGAAPPPHVHEQDEIVYILEGRARYHINGQVTEVGPGSVVYLPKGTEETFEPITTLRMIGVYTPAGSIDAFFAEAGQPAPRRELPPPPTSPPDFERLVALGAEHGLTLSGPPPH